MQVGMTSEPMMYNMLYFSSRVHSWKSLSHVVEGVDTSCDGEEERGRRAPQCLEGSWRIDDHDGWLY